MGRAARTLRGAAPKTFLVVASIGVSACTPTRETQEAVASRQFRAVAAPAAATPSVGQLPRPIRDRGGAVESVRDVATETWPSTCAELLARCDDPSDCFDRVTGPSWWLLYDGPAATSGSRARAREDALRRCRRAVFRRIGAGKEAILPAVIRSYDEIPRYVDHPSLAEEILPEATARPVDALLASQDPNTFALLFSFLEPSERKRPEVKAALTRKAVNVLAVRDAFHTRSVAWWLTRPQAEDLRPHADTILLALAVSVTEPDEAGLAMIAELSGMDDPRVDPILRRGLSVRSWRVNLATIDAIYESGRVSRFTGELAAVSREHWMPLVRAAASGDRSFARSWESLAKARREFVRPTCAADEEANSAWGRFLGREPRRYLVSRDGATSELQLVEDERTLPRDLPHLLVIPPTHELRTLDTHGDATDAVALPDGGWLVSFDRGEFGGALVYVDATEVPHVIARDVFSFFVATPQHLLVLRPAVYDDVEEARLIRIDTTTTPPRAFFFTSLPANVIGYWQEYDGTLLFATSAGLVDVDAEGDLAEVGCAADAI